MRTRASVGSLLGTLLLTVVTVPAGSAAQTRGELVIEAGAARSFPGSDVDGDAATYGLGGLVFDLSGERTHLAATVHGGWALDDSLGGDFLAGLLEGEAWTGAATALGVYGRAYGFRVQEPFAYRSATVRAGPAARVVRGGVRLELRIAAGVGTSVVELGVPTRRHGPRHPGGESEVNTDLWHWGGQAELAVPLGPLTGSATGGGWSSAGGTFGTAGAAVLGTVG